MVVEILGGQSAAASRSTLGRDARQQQYVGPLTFQGWATRQSTAIRRRCRSWIRPAPPAMHVLLTDTPRRRGLRWAEAPLP